MTAVTTAWDAAGEWEGSRSGKKEKKNPTYINEWGRAGPMGEEDEAVRRAEREQRVKPPPSLF